MGLFHCVQSECAQVRYRRYTKTSSIRYRYDYEDWIEVDGDDYDLLNNLQGQCSEQWTRYKVTFNCDVIDYDGNPGFGDNNHQFNLPLEATIIDSSNPVFLAGRYENGADRYQSAGIRYKDTNGNTNTKYVGTDKTLDGFVPNGISNVNIIRQYFDFSRRNYQDFPPEDDNCGSCQLIIYQKGAIVFERESNRCPEIEVLQDGNCQLSDRTKVIQIEKFPYLNRVEVVDFEYDVRYGLLTDSDNYGLVLKRGELPNECLNIYNNPITTLPPIGELSITNTPETGFRFVAQICSDPQCPPPEYEVICNCEEGCPSNTCSVECNGVICCYDPNTGRSVLELPVRGDS